MSQNTIKFIRYAASNNLDFIAYYLEKLIKELEILKEKIEKIP